MREHLDQTDRRLIKPWSQNAQLGVNRRTEKTGISVPTARARLSDLRDPNPLRIVGLLNLTAHSELIASIVGISAQGRGRAAEIAQWMAELPPVTSASVGTRRFDIIADAVAAGDVADLGRIRSELVPGARGPGEIPGRETLAVTDLCSERVSLPGARMSQGREMQARRTSA